MSNSTLTHDPSVGVRRQHLPNFVGEADQTRAGDDATLTFR